VRELGGAADNQQRCGKQRGRARCSSHADAKKQAPHQRRIRRLFDSDERANSGPRAEDGAAGRPNWGHARPALGAPPRPRRGCTRLRPLGPLPARGRCGREATWRRATGAGPRAA
jgi:hypothetical protein